MHYLHVYYYKGSITEVIKYIVHISAFFKTINLLDKENSAKTLYSKVRRTQTEKIKHSFNIN